MKNHLIGVASFFLALIFVGGVHAEAIRSYDTQISITKEGVIEVKEKIDYDFEYLYKHGIYREIPFIKKNKDGKQYKMDVNVVNVVDEEGVAYPSVTSEVNGQIQIKIGDPDRTITGLHSYTITYTVSGALTYFSDHDELYWNVTGNAWKVPMDNVSATVRFPDDMPMDGVKTACYTGVVGSSLTDCQMVTEGSSATISAAHLGEGEGLTVVVGFTKGYVAILEPTPYTSFEDTWYGKLILGILFALLGLAAFVWYIGLPIYIPYRWYRYGRDPKSTDVRVWYDPPQTKKGRKLTPAETGTLVDEAADVKDIFGSLIQLAEKGYLSIKEEKKGEFTLVEGRFAGEELLPFEKKLLKALFKDGNEIRVKDAKIVTEMQEVTKKLYEQVVSDGFFPESPEAVRTRYYILAGFAMFTGNFILGIIAFLFGRNMPRKTELGAAQASVGRSLKTFLSSQERQLAFQAKNQMMFEKLLPYAIAFGVEKIWAERFKDMALANPSWYTGYNNSPFNALYFTNTMHRSVQAFTTAVTPVQSSTGHSSGFSGGFSGGGGGGGGGGSW